MNKQKILILGGYSSNNKSWIDNMGKALNNYYIKVIKYDNWYNESEMNYTIEIEKIYSTIIENKIDTIIAKSIGIYLIIKLLKKYDVTINNIIFMGYPLRVLEENNLLIKNENN